MPFSLGICVKHIIDARYTHTHRHGQVVVYRQVLHVSRREATRGEERTRQIKIGRCSVGEAAANLSLILIRADRGKADITDPKSLVGRILLTAHWLNQTPQPLLVARSFICFFSILLFCFLPQMVLLSPIRVRRQHPARPRFNQNSSSYWGVMYMFIRPSGNSWKFWGEQLGRNWWIRIPLVQYLVRIFGRSVIKSDRIGTSVPGLMDDAGWVHPTLPRQKG